MKTFTSALLALAFVLPVTTHALSCVDPAGMLEHYAEDPTYVVFVGTAGETVEHVKQSADASGQDPNRQYNSGYVAQQVTPSKVYKGDIASRVWVYHQQDSTWGYLCSSGPVSASQEVLFVVRDQGDMFGLIEVVNTYPADSELATDIVAAVSDGEGESRIYETTKESRRADLVRQIRELVFLARIKLAELRWWGGQ